MLKNKKILQIGLGSMGKRRIRNLIALGINPQDIQGFDISNKRNKEIEKLYQSQIKTSNDFEKIYKELNPDILIISTPPNQHCQYFLKAAKDKKHFFVEVSTTDKGYDKLLSLLDNTFIAAPSCTFRYLKSIKKIKTLIDQKKIGRLLSFNYHFGQYLPDWHPWENYRKVYFSKKETGACREMFSYELMWINGIVNSKIKSIQGICKKVSNLNMKADDIYASIVEYENNVTGTILIDLLSRTAKRTLRLIGTDGLLDWEWQDYVIKIYTVKDKKFKTINLKKGISEKNYITTEDMYVEEMKEFLKSIKNNTQFSYTFKDDLETLRTLYALEKSARTKKSIIIKAN